MKRSSRDIVGDESGATAIEYGLMGALMAIIVVTVMFGLDSPLRSAYEVVIGAFAGTQL